MAREERVRVARQGARVLGADQSRFSVDHRQARWQKA